MTREKRTGSSRFPLWSMSALLVLLALGGGCSVVPQEIRQQVDRSISFQDLKENPEAFVGRTVLLGGEIIESRNLKDETELEILQKPLRRGDVPMETDESEGRFLVQRSGYLDTAIYGSGRYVTVVGEVMGEKSLQVGEMEYAYPLLTAKYLYLWPKAARYYGWPYDYPYGYPYWYPWYPYTGFYFGWNLFYPYPYSHHGHHGHGHKHGH